MRGTSRHRYPCDFQFFTASRIRDEDFAKLTQLGMEDDSQPTFPSGSPPTASPALATHVEQIGRKIPEDSRSAGADAMKRHGLA